ncbi:diguanylate cyclase [Sideroxyarcus emersonii]|uniref:sensor domain-containing diguanylate cyclase n=1 Tax=Sideroxyarcus emersonii TaxID=2764705 RepID=UPI001F2AA1E3|nr:diguanylate cyclase [Sideroxyarcus emersonii]
MATSTACQAYPQRLDGSWFQEPEHWSYHGESRPDEVSLSAVSEVAHTGGRFIYRADFEIQAGEPLVLDFKNSSVIGRFHHWIFDSAGRQVAVAEGGIQSTANNPFLLRHGRVLQLPPGRYRLVSELSSPFFLAQPQPYLDDLPHYQQSIKLGNALVLTSLGVLLGLGIYYAILALARHSAVEGMYALFILGNLFYNGTALLVYPDLFGLHWFYLISLPILFSNCAYVVFVIALLNIGRDSNPFLYRAGRGLLYLLGAFIVLAMLAPNWSLELDRYGVGLFLSYGLVAGIVRARQGHPLARMYLVAILAFFALGAVSISMSRLQDVYTIYMEHLGLTAVTVEALLLALVLAQQFARLHREKEDALQRLHRSQQIARTDTLTGLPNRYVLENELEQLPLQGSLTFIDLDGLKYYNDRFGHERGDELLRRFAHVLDGRLPKHANLHRLGGDEFAITCRNGDLFAIDAIMEATMGELRREGFEFAGASFGSVHVHENPAKDNLMRIADERMYANKRRRKSDITAEA